MGSFVLDLSKFIAKVPEKADQVVKKAIFDIFRDIVMATPVDTGRARGGWQVGGELGSGQTGLLDKGGTGALGNAHTGIQGLVARAEVVGYIFNNVEYIKVLEDGHSKQAPRGMVKVTLTRWQQYVEKAAGSL